MFMCFFLKNSLCSNTIIWDLAVLRLAMLFEIFKHIVGFKFYVWDDSVYLLCL